MRRTDRQHSFATIPNVTIPRSALSRSCGTKTTFNAGYLVPVFVDEALPGDTMTMRMTHFARLATPLRPLMDNLTMEVFFFFVPLRLLWDNFKRFMGEQPNPGDSTSFITPQISVNVAGSADVGTLWDYFGLPTTVGTYTTLTATAFHFRAYNLIWNDWFRDENLQNAAYTNKSDTTISAAQYPLLRRGKRHDYFTSALPWAQKGPAVTLPLGDYANIVPGTWTGPSGPGTPGLKGPTFQNTSGSAGPSPLVTGGGGNIPDVTIGVTTNWIASEQMYWEIPGLLADLTNSAGATINALREAFQLQRLYERDARGGTRYVELVRSHFGVSSPDARLQRPEFLGGGATRVTITPIPQTSSTDEAVSPQGNLAAYGTASGQVPSWTQSFTEHGVILGLVSVRADLNYQQGMNRMWWRQTRWDYYWPSLAHLGEQVIYSGELYSDGTAGDWDVFGYQERWAEYRYKPSMITGKLRSNYAQSLDTWHLAQDFNTRPLLNGTFIEENPPIDRVIALPGEPHFIYDAFFDYTCVRPMPTYSVPGLIDHF